MLLMVYQRQKRRCSGLSTFVRSYVRESSRPKKVNLTISPADRMEDAKHMLSYCIDTTSLVGIRQGGVNVRITYPHKISYVNKVYGQLMGQCCLSIVRYTYAVGP